MSEFEPFILRRAPDHLEVELIAFFGSYLAHQSAASLLLQGQNIMFYGVLSVQLFGFLFGGRELPLERLIFPESQLELRSIFARGFPGTNQDLRVDWRPAGDCSLVGIARGTGDRRFSRRLPLGVVFSI